MTPVALVYNVEGNRKKQIELLAACLGVRVRPVGPGEYGVPVGALCALEEGGGGAAKSLWSAFDEEMLVMAFFTEELLHRFLDSFRLAGVPSVRLKAVLTETNKGWNSSELRAELLREEGAFRAMKEQRK